MSKQRFCSGVRFRWRGATYQIVQLLPDGQANLEELLTGDLSTMEIATLVRALFDAKLQFHIEKCPRRVTSKQRTGLSEHASVFPTIQSPWLLSI